MPIYWAKGDPYVPKDSSLKNLLLGAIIVAGVIALPPPAMALNNNDHERRMYRVTIINATLGQPVAPSVIATLTDVFQLFELGPTPEPEDSDYAFYFGLATAAEIGLNRNSR